jgi:hypothetical protein
MVRDVTQYLGRTNFLILLHFVRSESDLKGWLEDHGLKTKPKSTREELVDQVRKNWDTTRSYVGSAANRGQQVFEVFRFSPPPFPFAFIHDCVV